MRVDHEIKNRSRLTREKSALDSIPGIEGGFALAQMRPVNFLRLSKTMLLYATCSAIKLLLVKSMRFKTHESSRKDEEAGIEPAPAAVGLLLI